MKSFSLQANQAAKSRAAANAGATYRAARSGDQPRALHHVIFPDVVKYQQAAPIGKPALSRGNLLLGRLGLNAPLELGCKLSRDLGYRALAAELKHYRLERSLPNPHTATRDSAAMKAAALTDKFRQDWWIPSIGLFADSLALSQKVVTDPLATVGTLPGYTQLQGLNWIDVAPMETSFASVTDASMAFPQLESSTFTGTTGSFNKAKACRPSKAILKPLR